MSPATPNGTQLIAFARHGETAWTGKRFAGQSDLPLTDHGRASAASLASRVMRSGLMDHPASVIVASPLRRARETAQIVAEAVDRPVETDPRWMEVGFGSIEGLTFDEASIAWPAVIARISGGDLAIDWPGGETSLAVRERVTAALDDVLGRDVPVLVVAHGIAIRAALMVLVGTPAEPDSLPGLAPAGLIFARRSGRGWVLETPELDGNQA